MQTDQLADRIFGSVLGTLDVLTVHVGDQLGLYAALRDHGALTPAGLADHAGIHARYAREWLEQQTVAGFLVVEDATASAEERRYSLPEEHAAVLVEPDHLAFSAPFARMLAAAAVQLPALTEAYRSGGGVPWGAYGALMRTAQADANRPLFLGPLGDDWLPSLPHLDAVLRGGGRVADIGCGDGWSAIGIARAYPAATVDGFDVDADSVAAATRNAADHGVADRVRFSVVDAAHAPGEAAYDLVTAFECVHDLPDPVAVLGGARRLLRPGGTMLVMDERVPDTFTGPGDPVEQFMYGVSLLVCLPDGMAHEGSVGTGTVMRADTLRRYAADAGFDSVEVLPVEHDMFRFYALTP